MGLVLGHGALEGIAITMRLMILLLGVVVMVRNGLGKAYNGTRDM
jgi:hypothetical protein